jgi:hypothetical protein
MVEADPRRCWTLTDGGIGMVNQAVGLAEAMGLTPEPKLFRPRWPWRALAPALWLRPLAAAGPGSDPLQPPWPDLVISCGSKAVAPALAIGRAGGGRTRTIHVQDPTVAPARFDLVVVPQHDRARGPNVIVTLGSVGRTTPERLVAAADAARARYAHLPAPHIAVLIGGNNACYRLTPAIAARLAEQVVALARAQGGSLLVTTSRRTGAENEQAIAARLAEVPHERWDGQGENPFFAYLGLADAVVVTCDSVNMVTEAAATGRPVYVAALEGKGSAKFRRFHDAMQEAGITRPFDGRLERWSYPPLRETERAATEARARLGWD